MYIVYMHTNKYNNKKYIGTTRQSDPNKRWQNGNGYRKNIHFWNSIQKYGWDGFEHRVLRDDLTKDEAFNMEKQLIEKYHTTNPVFGYNITKGGDGALGLVHTAESKEKISKRMRGQLNPNYQGKTNTPEQMAKLLAANIGSKHTEEHKRKIGDSLRGRHYHDDNFKEMMREKLSRRVIRDDGVEYHSVKEAASANGVTDKAIIKAMKRGHKSAGHRWVYADEMCNDYPKREQG